MDEIEGLEGGSSGLSSNKRRVARHVERGARGRRMEGRMEEGLGSVRPRGGGRRGGGGGAGSRQGTQPAEAVAGQASTTPVGERGLTREWRELGLA
jgi:hypothetical protein